VYLQILTLDPRKHNKQGNLLYRKFHKLTNLLTFNLFLILHLITFLIHFMQQLLCIFFFPFKLKVHIKKN